MPEGCAPPAITSSHLLLMWRELVNDEPELAAWHAMLDHGGGEMSEASRSLILRRPVV